MSNTGTGWLHAVVVAQHQSMTSNGFQTLSNLALDGTCLFVDVEDRIYLVLWIHKVGWRRQLIHMLVDHVAWTLMVMPHFLHQTGLLSSLVDDLDQLVDLGVFLLQLALPTAIRDMNKRLQSTHETEQEQLRTLA